MRATLLIINTVLATTAVASDAPLPEGARLRIGDPNALRAVDGSFAFSPDGKWFYVSETRDTIRPWNLVDRTRGKAIKGPAPYYIFAPSPDGKWLANREQLNTVRLWSVATGSKERLWTAPGQVGRVVFTADSKFLVASHEGKEFGKPSEMTVWDVTADAPVRTFVVGAGKDPRVSSFAVSPDGKYVAVVGYDVGPVRVFGLETGKEVGAFGKTNGIGQQVVAFKGADRLLVALGYAVSEFDVTKPDTKPVVTQFPRNVEAVAPDGSRVAVATAEFARFEIWDAAANKPGKTVGVEHARTRSGMGFSPDGRTFALVSGNSQDSPPRLWDTATGAELFANPGHPVAVQALAVIEGGKTLASGAADGRLRFWDLATGVAKKPFDLTATHLELTADGTRMLTASGGGFRSLGNVRVYETATLKALAHYTDTGTAAALSPDGKRVAVGTKGGIRVYDVDAEKLIADEDFKPALRFGQGLAFGPDGKRLIAQPDNGLLLFDALAKQKPKDSAYVQTDGFVRSPDAKLLAAVRQNPARVAVLDSATGREITSLKAEPPTAIGWSRDGKWVGTADGPTLRVWSATTGETRLKRIGHDGPIRAIAFAPDGKTVATGGDDNLVYIWDLPPAP